MLDHCPIFWALQDKTVVLDLWAAVSLGVWILAGERHYFTWWLQKPIVSGYLAMQTSVVFAPMHTFICYRFPIGQSVLQRKEPYPLLSF